MAKTSKTMSSIFSFLSTVSDDAYWWLQIASLCLIGLSVAVGGFTIATGWKINRRQAREIEDLKLKRLELEKAVAPRQLGLLFTPTGTNFDALKPFAGMQVIVRVLPDIEAMRASEDLVMVMQAAGWKILNIARSAELNIPFWDGVVIEPYRIGEKELSLLSDPAKSPEEKQKSVRPNAER